MLKNHGTAYRMAQVQPFYVMELLAKAKAMEAEGRSILHMEVGEPDFATPDPIVSAGIQALEQGMTHYTPAAGIPELRAAIAQEYQRRFGVNISTNRIVVTPGASGALQLVVGCLINPGDEVLMADPGYPCNRNFVYHVGGVPVSLAVGPESRYQLTAERIDQAWTENTRAVLVASPSNPTGTLISRSEMAKIHQVVSERGGTLIVDEIYQGLVYGAEESTALSVADNCFVINSFSKLYGMTGWRLGWLVAPADYVGSAERLAQNIFLAASTPAQYAALAAFEPATQEILEQRRHEFGARRDFLLPALRELGFEMQVTPEGAFYLYANCQKFTQDSYQFAFDLLEQEGVAITPGKDFGLNQPSTHLRFAYTTSIANLQEAVNRISRFVGI